MWPPARAAAAIRSAAVCGTCSLQTMSMFLAIRQFACPGHRRLNRVQERGADAGLLELADRRDRRAAGRRHRLAQLDRMHALVAQLLRGAEHRLDDELRRDLAREPEQQPGLDHGL